jgi:hypothetical protein
MNYVLDTTAFFLQLAERCIALIPMAEESTLYKTFNLATLRTAQRLLCQVPRATPELVLDTIEALKDVGQAFELQMHHLDHQLDRAESRLGHRSIQHEYDTARNLNHEIWGIIGEIEEAFGLSAEVG